MKKCRNEDEWNGEWPILRENENVNERNIMKAKEMKWENNEANVMGPNQWKCQ
jgi:hypothetical protein